MIPYKNKLTEFSRFYFKVVSLYYKKGNATIIEVLGRGCLKKLKNNVKTIFYSFTKNFTYIKQSFVKEK